MQETPTISGTTYGTSVTTNSLVGLGLAPQSQQALAGAATDFMARHFANNPEPPKAQPKEIKVMSTAARIVKVFIADSNENLPLDKRVLYSGEEKLTDLTDQELFFDVPIVELLGKHNKVRETTVDKKSAEKFGRDIFLEPARIRDLKMVVVTVAQF